MHSRQAAPVDERPEHAAIAEVRQSRLDPRNIEFEILSVAHFAGGHCEFAMRAAGDIAGDFHVIGFVGQNGPRRRVAVHQSGEHRRIGRIAADEPVRAELEHVAHTSDGNSARGSSQRTLLKGIDLVADDDPVDLVEREAGD